MNIIKNNNNKNFPKIGVFLDRKMFNTLITILKEIHATKRIIGETEYAINAYILEKKIMRYGRKFESRGCKNAAIYFFEKEAATLIGLLILYASFSVKNDRDYFCDVKARRKRLRGNGGKGAKAPL